MVMEFNQGQASNFTKEMKLKPEGFRFNKM